MRRLKVAVVGAGFWGRNQVRILSEMDGAELAGVCDVDEDRARLVGEKYGVPWFVRLEELLRSADFEAATVCTPTVTHADVARRLLAEGKHALVEKPMTETVEEGEELVSLAERNGVFLSVGFVERFNPAVRYLKSLIESGRLGKVILIMARRVARWPERIGDVGVTKDAAIHDIDVMRFLLGREASSVYARAGSLRHKFEDYSEIMVSFDGGEVGFIDANWLTPRKVRRLVVTGSEATATVDYLTQEVTVEDSEATVKPRIRWEEPLRLELESFVKSISAGRQPEPTGLDGLKALKICEAALESSKLNKAVKLLS
ncbi:TPA: Gfo/Idh/MocA family oxidoreductase [Candidatus Bathyarchaeota archaeon]|nr:Gfo/Idh/MocA family oxidoreductase [Candidatus Bathyarchaeota archaeon]